MASGSDRPIQTRQKQDPSVQSLLQTQSLLAAIVESSDDAIISKDLNGTITSWNSGAERLFGYTAGEIVGQSILCLIPEDLQHEEQGIIARLRRGERIVHFETSRLRKTGERLALSLTISPVRNADGIVVGASKIARDISERKQMEKLLVDTEKIVATGRMAATIAHEINNPLEAVVNLIYLARISPSVNDEVREYLRLAEREIERVSLIARQTLGYFRETADPVKVSISTLLDEVLTVYGAKLTLSRIEVQRAMDPVSPLLVRRSELTQVFANLLSNAIDSMPEGGSLSISVAEEQEAKEAGVRVRLGDSGSGITTELLDRIFEPFFTTKQHRGTGIGLWISRQFIEAHCGTISVTSSTEPADHGTSFNIFLPYGNGLDRDLSTNRQGANA